MDQQRLLVKFLTGTAFVLVVGLAWMHWRSEDREAARVRKEVETLRQKLADAEAEVKARAEAGKALAEGRLKRV